MSFVHSAEPSYEDNSVSDVRDSNGLQRINIQERKCGCPLFVKVWQWKADQKTPANVCALVQFFYQFAREIDKGQVRRVVFSKSTPAPQRVTHRVSYGVGSLARAPKVKQPKSSQQVLEMYSAQNEHIVVALFVSPEFSRDKSERLVADALQLFTKAFKPKLEELQPKFVELSKNAELAQVDESLLPTFADFEETVEKLKESV